MIRVPGVVSFAVSFALLVATSAARADDAPRVGREASATLEVHASEPTPVAVTSQVQTLRGTTPLTLSLAPGSYVVYREGTERPTRISFDLAAGDHRRVELPSEPRRSSTLVWVALAVGAVAAGATVGVVALAQ